MTSAQVCTSAQSSLTSVMSSKFVSVISPKKQKIGKKWQGNINQRTFLSPTFGQLLLNLPAAKPLNKRLIYSNPTLAALG